MATIEGLTKRLDAIEQDRVYLRFDEIVSALEHPLPGESLFETLHREYPGKTFHPDLLSLPLGKPPEDRSKSL